MRTELTEAIWLDELGGVTLIELARCSGLSEAELRELVDLGALEPLNRDVGELEFAATCISAARAARRLRTDFELQPPGLALVLSLLDRVRDLETQLRDLQAHLPRLTRY